ncbi:CarD family transcriptional regulator [Intestinimonas massiliensis (ex Afouda et al. 2020)]|uniref:CarD family transcriptional regulator n=1 Tax=Intestinimonas massiliensis (ex Afouda et al. 2020) TaxID=1673721 RepID=UPI00102F8041|nr:CarD family transcriptional regulator [Intestinimonas massiliensis (ex Afouda et al. 2020)]
MYQIGDLVVYGGSGVCQVTAVGEPACQPGSRRLYYTLRPLHGTEVIYAPVDCKVSMRPVLTAEEAEQLIGQLPAIQAEPPETGNVQLLSRRYQDAFRSNSCLDLARLLKTIYQKDSAARSQGRRPGKVEEHFRKRAEDLLYGELSIALSMPMEEIPGYIRRRLTSRTPA